MRISSVTPVILLALLASCGGTEDAGVEFPACNGGSSGNMSLTDRAEMVYSISFGGDTTRPNVFDINAVFVGRGAPGWKGQARQVERPAELHDSLGISGGTAGSLFLGVNRRTRTAWIHGQPMALDSFNVVLVDRVDSVGGPPVVAGRVRIAPSMTLAPEVCSGSSRAAYGPYADSLRAVLLRTPEIREFAAGR